MNLYVLYTPKIFAKIIESLMGIKLTLKTLKYEMLLLFDDGVVISIALLWKAHCLCENDWKM